MSNNPTMEDLGMVQADKEGLLLIVILLMIDALDEAGPAAIATAAKVLKEYASDYAVKMSKRKLARDLLPFLKEAAK